MATGGIDDDDLDPLLFELFDALLGDGDGVGLGVATVEGDADASGVLFQLVEGTCSEGIGADHGYSPAFLFVVVGVFCAGGGLTTALQPDQHHYAGLALLRDEGFALNL